MAETTILTNCDNCGACCMGQNLLPLTGNFVDETPLSSFLGVPLERMLEGPLCGDDGCPCVWLDRFTGRCRHYEDRPSMCHGLKVGDEDCLRIRREAGLDG